MNVYEREFSVSQGTQFVMPAGETNMCFTIGFPQEGAITRLIVRQALDDANQVGFKVNLYDRQVCTLGPEESESMAVDSMSPAIGKIIPTQPTDGSFTGAGDEMFLGDVAYGYRNREGSYAVPVRAIYLEIIVDDNSAETNWEVAVAADIGSH